MMIKVGYYHWNEFGLNDFFYPDDMPEEWRLAFYANEIECVQISLSDLSRLDDIEDAFDSINDQFNLILYCDDVNQWSLLSELLDNDEINITALLCSELCQQKWSELLESYSVPCFIDGEQRAIAFNKEMKGRQIESKDLSILYIDESLGLKQLRMMIDQWMLSQKSKEHYLLLNPAFFKSSAAGEIRMLIEMMGL